MKQITVRIDDKDHKELSPVAPRVRPGGFRERLSSTKTFEGG